MSRQHNVFVLIFSLAEPLAVSEAPRQGKLGYDSCSALLWVGLCTGTERRHGSGVILSLSPEKQFNQCLTSFLKKAQVLFFSQIRCLSKEETKAECGEELMSVPPVTLKFKLKKVTVQAVSPGTLDSQIGSRSNNYK